MRAAEALVRARGMARLVVMNKRLDAEVDPAHRHKSERLARAAAGGRGSNPAPWGMRD